MFGIKQVVFAVAAIVAVAVGIVYGSFVTDAAADSKSAQALIRNVQGDVVGVAKFSEEDGSTFVKVSVNSLPAGFHGFHVHAVGQCAAPFLTAGGHFDGAGGRTHGQHAGDLPVLLVNADGTGEARFKTDAFDVAELFDADGSALIVHANPDNYANIPSRYAATPDALTLATGDAGGRIACGVIE